MDKSKSSHILTTSSNLVGFSFFVLTTIKTTGLGEQGISDELSVLAVFIFSISCFISFLSIRINEERKSRRYEYVADYLFFVGLLLLVIISALIVTNTVTLNPALLHK